MKEKIAGLFLIAIGLMAVPVSGASVTRSAWNVDGSQPPIEPPPWGIEIA
jgi:hypothetical protein